MPRIRLFSILKLYIYCNSLPSQYMICILIKNVDNYIWPLNMFLGSIHQVLVLGDASSIVLDSCQPWAEQLWPNTFGRLVADITYLTLSSCPNGYITMKKDRTHTHHHCAVLDIELWNRAGINSHVDIKLQFKLLQFRFYYQNIT